MIKYQQKIIVFGGHVQALGIVRILGQMGCNVTVCDETKKNIARHSRYCNQFVLVKNQEILLFLSKKSTIERFGGAILFPTNDEHVEILSRNKQELEKHYIVATDVWVTIEKTFHKKHSYKLAKESGLPIAETYFPENLTDLQSISGRISYPCILKPAVMFRFYNVFKKKVFVCNSPEELLENYNRAATKIPSGDIIIQDIIPGGSQHQYSVGCLFDGEEMVCGFMARRLRQHPIDFGNATTFAETVNIPEVMEYAKIILSSIKYKGVCEVEFKWDERDQKFKFLEINARTWKWHSLAQKADVPMLENYVKMLTGQKTYTNLSWKEASWGHYITDFPVLLKLFVKRRYHKPLSQPKMQAVFSWNDLKPGIREILYLPYLIKSR